MYFEMMALLTSIYWCKENKGSFFLEPLRWWWMMRSANSLLWNSAPTWLSGEVLVFNLASCFIYLMITAYHCIRHRLSIFSQYSTCSILSWAQILMGAGLIPLLQDEDSFLIAFPRCTQWRYVWVDRICIISHILSISCQLHYYTPTIMSQPTAIISWLELKHPRCLSIPLSSWLRLIFHQQPAGVSGWHLSADESGCQPFRLNSD